MADSKLTALSAFTPIATDLLYGVDDPGGTPVSGKFTIAALATLLFASPALVTPTLGVASATSVTASGLLQAGSTLGINTDVLLARDAAAALAQRNSTTAQAFRVYNTWTDASNYERGVFDWTTTANVLSIGVQAAGTGTVREIRIGNTNAPAAISLAAANGAMTVAVGITTGGAGLTAALAPGYGTYGVALAASLDIVWSGGATVYGVDDTYIGRLAAATIRLGAAAAASPVAQTLATQGSRSGTDSNVGGANLTLQSGIGTGTGTLSTLALKSPIAVGSGTGAQTMVTGLLIRAGIAVLTSYTVATLPAAATAGAGAIAAVTDQLTTVAAKGVAPTGGGAVYCLVTSDGSGWVGV